MNNHARWISRIKSFFPTAADAATAATNTATSDGLTTGVISSAVAFTTVTSANADYIAALPTPAAGKLLVIHVTANGCEFRTGTGVYMNGVIGASTKELAIGANTISICFGLDATHWLVMTTTAGVPDGV